MMMGNINIKTSDCHTPENRRTDSLKRLDAELDPRSPTFEFQRTPIYVERFHDSPISSTSSNLHQSVNCGGNPEAEVNESSLSRTFSDPSMILSELNISDQTDTVIDDSKMDSSEDKVIGVSSSPLSPVVIYTDENDTPMSSTPEKQPTSKFISVTPVARMTDISGKKLFTSNRLGRKPLENVQNTSSPQQLLRAKQWSNFQEERMKRGIQVDENTPPPKFDGCASAPGKLIARRLHPMIDN